MELSTAGWRKPVNELYPSDQIIALALAKGIPFTTASDAHSHAQLGENYDRLVENNVASSGITRVSVFRKTSRSTAERRTLTTRLATTPIPPIPIPPVIFVISRLRQLFALRDRLFHAAQDRFFQKVHILGIDNFFCDFDREDIAGTVRDYRNLPPAAWTSTVLSSSSAWVFAICSCIFWACFINLFRFIIGVSSQKLQVDLARF